MIKLQLTGESIIFIGHSHLRKVVNKLIIHGRRHRQTAVARDVGMEKLHVMLKGATFDYLSYETFALRFGILSHADEKEQAASDNGDDDNNKNQRLSALARLRQRDRAPALF